MCEMKLVRRRLIGEVNQRVDSNGTVTIITEKDFGRGCPVVYVVDS